MIDFYLSNISEQDVDRFCISKDLNNSLQTEKQPDSFQIFINKVKQLLDRYFPMRKIMINSSDPKFVTGNIK